MAGIQFPANEKGDRRRQGIATGSTTSFNKEVYGAMANSLGAKELPIPTDGFAVGYRGVRRQNQIGEGLAPQVLPSPGSDCGEHPETPGLRMRSVTVGVVICCLLMLALNILARRGVVTISVYLVSRMRQSSPLNSEVVRLHASKGIGSHTAPANEHVFFSGQDSSKLQEVLQKALEKVASGWSFHPGASTFSQGIIGASLVAPTWASLQARAMDFEPSGAPAVPLPQAMATTAAQHGSRCGAGSTMAGDGTHRLGAGSELGPVRPLLEAGATVCAVATRRPKRWAELIAFARRSAGTLLVPVYPGQTVNNDEVRLTVASDYIVDAVKSLGKDKVSFAYLAPW
eukprot:Skav224128  [mRNA]  locus=scaffold2427:412354:420008:- [translate_table: standard]